MKQSVLPAALFCLAALLMCGQERMATAQWDVFAPFEGRTTRCAVPVKNNAFRLVLAARKNVWIFPARNDFSEYNAIGFELENQGKPGSPAEMGILLRYGGNPKVVSYFMTRVQVDFSGRKKFVIPFVKMNPCRKPKLNPISFISFIADGWGIRNAPGFAVSVSGLELLKLTPAALKILDPDLKPVTGFREMRYPNYCGTTRAEVEKIAAALPEHPGLPGGTIHDRRFWAQFPVNPFVAKRAEDRLLRKPPRYTRADYDLRKPWPHGGSGGLNSELGRYLASMTVMECHENKGRFIPKITEVIESYLDNPVPAAHIIFPENLILKQGFRYIELMNSQCMADLATAYFLLDDKLPPGLRKRIRDYLDEWIFSPMFRNLAMPDQQARSRLNFNTWHMNWLNGSNNWNTYCSWHVLICTHAILGNREQRAYLTASLINSMKSYFNSMTSAGYISEGVGYWMMGFSSYLYCARLLKEISGGRIDLLADADPKIRRSTYIGRNMMLASDGLYPAFSDGARGNGLPSPFPVRELVWMNQAFGEKIYPAPEEYPTSDGRFLSRDYFFTWEKMNQRKNLKAADPEQLFFLDPEAQILVVRDDPKASVPFSFAIKGGHNGELHNHNDIGSFVVGAGFRILCGDPGCPVYSSPSAKIVRSSLMHPVPLPNGIAQGTGRAFQGKILKIENDARHHLIRLDLLHAYPERAGLAKLVRTAEYDRKNRRIVITDECEMKQPGSYELPLFSYTEWRKNAPGAWSAGNLAVKIKTSTPMEITADIADVQWPDKRKSHRLSCRFREKATSFRMTLTFVPIQPVNR